MDARINSHENILCPAHVGDAGFDLIAASGPMIIGFEPIKNFYSRIDYIEYDTNLIIAPEEGYHTHVYPRSSLSKTNLILANHVATIDNAYRGTVKLRFKYCFQIEDLEWFSGKPLIEIDQSKIYQKGDKIAQMVFTKTLVPQLVVVDSFEDTKRNTGGFGSTGA